MTKSQCLAEMDVTMFEEHLAQCSSYPELATGLEIHIYSVSTKLNQKKRDCRQHWKLITGIRIQKKTHTVKDLCLTMELKTFYIKRLRNPTATLRRGTS
jgi:hypothetical protein